MTPTFAGRLHGQHQRGFQCTASAAACTRATTACRCPRQLPPQAHLPPTCTPAHCRTAGCSGASAPLCRSHTAPPGWPGSPCPPGGGTAQRRRGGRRHRQARRAAALPHRPRASARRSALPVQCLRDAGWAAWQVDVEAVNNSGLKQVLPTQPQAGPWYAASRHGPQPPHLQAHATAC